MPEQHFAICWPDGVRETCYSPSSIVRDHFAAGNEYELPDFLGRCRVALTAASERVRQKYGMPCSLALGQLARIETTADRFRGQEGARVRFESFEVSTP
jgi:uncharacterized repeat protein (TIGR04042 family)